MKTSIYFWALLTAFTFSSCESGNDYRAVGGSYESKEVSYDESAPTGSANVRSGTGGEEGEPAAQIDNITDRKITKQGDIRFQTGDASQTKLLITKTILESGGYIAQEETFNYDDRDEYRIEIRVPADKFDPLLSKISESAEKLDSKNISAMDVTEEFIDISARLKTKKELEERYKALLKQATKVEEILAIEKEAGQLRSDIESIEGRLNYLKDRISLSTLTVTYYQKGNTAFGLSSKLKNGIQGGWNNLLWFFVGLTHMWPFVLIIAAAIFFFIRQRRKRKNRTA